MVERGEEKEKNQTLCTVLLLDSGCVDIWTLKYLLLRTKSINNCPDWGRVRSPNPQP
jgi:hypothetical protein